MQSEDGVRAFLLELDVNTQRYAEAVANPGLGGATQCARRCTTGKRGTIAA